LKYSFTSAKYCREYCQGSEKSTRFLRLRSGSGALDSVQAAEEKKHYKKYSKNTCVFEVFIHFSKVLPRILSRVRKDEELPKYSRRAA